jgi:hypothetical protein
MAINQLIWSYGQVKLFKSSGPASTVSDYWTYGNNAIQHEWVDLPEITDMEDELFTNIENSVVITGADFIAAQGDNGKVEFGDSATYAGSNLKEMDVVSWSDTSITINIRVLPEDDIWVGTLYVWITNNSELRSPVGYEITVVGYAPSTEDTLYAKADNKAFSKESTNTFYIK